MKIYTDAGLNLSATGHNCLGGGMRAKIWPHDQANIKSLVQVGWVDKIECQFMSRDLANGENILFTATGITTSPLLKGIEVIGSTAISHSVLMWERTRIVRFKESHHNLKNNPAPLLCLRSKILANPGIIP